MRVMKSHFGSVVETNRNAFIRDVVRLDLQRPEQRRTEIHALILRTFFELDHLGGLHAAAGALGQGIQILLRHGEVG